MKLIIMDSIYHVHLSFWARDLNMEGRVKNIIYVCLIESLEKAQPIAKEGLHVSKPIRKEELKANF